MDNIIKVQNFVNSGLTINEALKEVYAVRRVSIPFNDVDFDIHISQLGLGTRANNSLLRAGFQTLMDAINHINENGWNSIKTFGKNCAVELYEKIVEVAWDGMTEEEKLEFLKNVDMKSTPKAA